MPSPGAGGLQFPLPTTNPSASATSAPSLKDCHIASTSVRRAAKTRRLMGFFPSPSMVSNSRLHAESNSVSAQTQIWGQMQLLGRQIHVQLCSLCYAVSAASQQQPVLRKSVLDRVGAASIGDASKKMCGDVCLVSSCFSRSACELVPTRDLET